jgi:hypothetical protein
VVVVTMTIKTVASASPAAPLLLVITVMTWCRQLPLIIIIIISNKRYAGSSLDWLIDVRAPYLTGYY